MSSGVCPSRQTQNFSLPNRMEQLTTRLYLRALDQYEKLIDKKVSKSSNKVGAAGKQEATETWTRKDESPLSGFRRWRRASPAPPAHHPSELLKFLAINALDLTAPASDVLLKNREDGSWFQLAGHPGSLAPAGPGTVWKRAPIPEGATVNPERAAYEALSACPHMRSAVPRYYRELEYGSERFIELQDLLHGFRDPHVMDVKMGTRTFLECEVSKTHARADLYEKMVKVDPNAPTPAEREARAVTKLRYMQFRERQSSTSSEGYRIEAVKLPGAPPVTDLKKVKSQEQVLETIDKFLGGREDVRRKLVARLEEIRDTFEKSEFFRNHEVVGSSIFMIFDEEKVGAWLIDFAKTQRTPDGLTVTHREPWQQGNHEEGFLFGLDRLIAAMKAVRLTAAGAPTR